MKCEGLKKLLSEGHPLTDAARDHLVTCTGCRALLEALTLPESYPSRKRINDIEQLITTSLKPVRRLPSDQTLIWYILALFTAVSLIVASLVGYNGFRALTPYERFVYYTVITFCAVAFAITAVQQMIPGSNRKADPRSVMLAALVVLGLLATMLFHNYDVSNFVRLGFPCLRLGCVCAVISGGLSWFIFRKGFFSSPLEADTTAGVFAGLVGVSVLALHCPITNSAHIIVWHLGTMILGGFGGALIGILQLRTPPNPPSGKIRV